MFDKCKHVFRLIVFPYYLFFSALINYVTLNKLVIECRDNKSHVFPKILPTQWEQQSDVFEGKRRSYELGKALRERYGKWFTQYSRKIVDFRSAGNERSTMTTSLVAAGLFPPNNGSQRWNPSLNWQPIPISLSNSLLNNILFFGVIYCEKYVTLLEKTKLTDPEIIDYDAKMKEIYDYISPNIGGPVNNRIFWYLYMELLAAVSGGLSPPKWAEEIFYGGVLKQAAIMEYRYASWNDKLKRLTGGIWLKSWLDHVDEYLSEVDKEKSSKSNKIEVKKRAIFYGGHDINVAGIMMTLGVFTSNPHVPNYASVVNLELHENEEQRFYVKVIHRDSDTFIEYLIPGCEKILCPLETFRNLFSNVMVFNVTEDCGSYIL